MPNHVYNTITINGTKEQVQSVLEFLRKKID